MSVLLAVSGCAVSLPQSQPTPVPPPTGPASLVDRYVATVTGTYGYSEATNPDTLLDLGRLACIEIAKEASTHSKVVAAVDAASGEVSNLGARTIVEAARLHLCPGKTYAANRVLPIEAPTSVAVPTPTPIPIGPPTSMTQGTYEVGVDVEAGKYKTAGSSGCYWARLRENDGSVGDIIDNNFGPGQQVTTIKKGEYFQTRGCGVWAKSG